MSNNSFDDEQALGDAVEAAREEERKDEEVRQMLKSRPMGRWRPHRMPTDPVCSMCKLDSQFAAQIKSYYTQGCTRAQIIKEFKHTGITPFDFDRHANAHNWRWDRTVQTEKVLGKLVKKGMQNLDKPGTVVEPDLLLKTVQHIDKRSGKVVEVTRQEASVTLNFVVEGVPMPQAARGLATEQAKLGPSTSRVVAPVSVLSMEVPDAVEAVQVAVEPTTDAGGTSG